MERLQRVAAALAQYGQRDMAGEIAEVSLAVKRAAGPSSRTAAAPLQELLERAEDLQQRAEAFAKQGERDVQRYTQKYEQSSGLPDWVGAALDDYESATGSFWFLENATRDLLKILKKLPK